MRKVKVTLRKKPISKNRWSLYLEYYPPVWDHKADKKISKEYLGLHIYQDELNHLHSEHNRMTTKKAEGIKEYREVTLKTNDGFLYGMDQEVRKDILRCFYLAALKHDYRWMVTYKHFEKFIGGDICYEEDLTYEFIESFHQYLLKAKQLKHREKKLSSTSAEMYFSIFKKFIKEKINQYF